MSTVLTNGIIIPENGSRNWGGDLANNWNIIDLNVGYMTDVKNRVTTLENSVAENSANIQINTSNISALQTSKQDTIEDLETIRAGASAGATAVQPSALNNYVDLSSEQTITGAKTFSSRIVGSIDQAEKDLNGNIITSTYATKTELANKANDGDVVHKSGNETVNGVKTFTNIITSNKELHYKDAKYDWTDTSLHTWLDAGHVAWLDRTGTRRMHELVGTDYGIWNKSCYINENFYFSVNSNREIRFEGNSFKWNGKQFAYAYNATMTSINMFVGSVLTSDGKRVSFVVPINIDGSPTISFTRLRLRCNGNYLFGSTINNDVTTSYTFNSTVINGGLNVVIDFSDPDTKAINNSCIISEIILKLTY